jgi:hypothetical protein
VKQLQLIRDWVGGARYNEALKLWHRLSTFIGQVTSEEQPFHRVDDFVQYAARQRKPLEAFAFDETRIQRKGHLQALSLSLKCEIIIISDFLRLREELSGVRPELKLDFSQQMKDCDTLAESAKATKHPRQETEAHVYCAQFWNFSRAFSQPSDDSLESGTDVFKEQASNHLTTARHLVKMYGGQTQGIMAEIEAAEKMFRNSVYYSSVSAEEMRAVYRAMSREFSGTGHWYTCENDHPFTIGECGMPVQMARCPECGAAVGGSNHAPAQGVRRADEIEGLARDVGRIGI